jgi:hypothetical protein
VEKVIQFTLKHSVENIEKGNVKLPLCLSIIKASCHEGALFYIIIKKS